MELSGGAALWAEETAAAKALWQGSPGVFRESRRPVEQGHGCVSAGPEAVPLGPSGGAEQGRDGGTWALT